MLLGVVWGAVVLLTGGRFLALLAGANRDSDLVQRLYDWSEVLVEPFFNTFELDNEAVTGTGGVFEPASLLAFGVYMAIGALVRMTIYEGVRHAQD
jgi:hypothetical protein